MGYLATREFFENVLQLKRFGLYFERIMNTKWLLSYRNNDISYRDARVYVYVSHLSFTPYLKLKKYIKFIF